MKSIYLFSTKLRMYWVILPMAFLLALGIIYNPYATGWIKLYPLIIASSCGIAFMFWFYFRLIKLNFAEIKDIGRFSPRDSALINAGKRLVLVPAKRGSVKLYLYGNDGLPELDWVREQTTNPAEICMYRGRTQGGKRTLHRVLRYFGVPSSDICEILDSTEFSRDYELVSVYIDKDTEGVKQYCIRINETV